MSCNERGNCCCNASVVTDCICCSWSLEGKCDPPVLFQTIFKTNGLCPFLTGKIRYCSACSKEEDEVPPRSVFVQFVRGNKVIDSIELYCGTCFSFNVTKIDSIRVQRVSEEEPDISFTVCGEYCITTNYLTH